MSRLRWALLKHIQSQHHHNRFHFDLLLEDKEDCRSWRLDKFPQVDGPALKVIPISPHNLSWLTCDGREVSGGRGWASPVASGYFLGELPIDYGIPFSIELIGDDLNGKLDMEESESRFRSSKIFNF